MRSLVFLKISSYEMCTLGKLDNSEHQLFQILKSLDFNILNNHVSVKGYIIHVTEIYEMGLTS